MTIKKIFQILSISSILLLPPHITSAAGSVSGNIEVSAEVVASCTVSAQPLSFGQYLLAKIDATTNLSVTCTNGTQYSISLSPGGATNATTETRRMTSVNNSNDTLGYQLFKDSGRTQVWGDNSMEPNQSPTVYSATGTAQTYTVYGTIPADQNSPIGDYRDTVVIVVNF